MFFILSKKVANSTGGGFFLAVPLLDDEGESTQHDCTDGYGADDPHVALTMIRKCLEALDREMKIVPSTYL